MTGLNNDETWEMVMEKKLIGYMVTWTTYGTWLQGDERGYVKDGVILPGNEKLKAANQEQQESETVRLNAKQKQIVERAILDEAQKISQKIFAIAVCSNHIHIVAEVSSESIEKVVHRYKRLSTFVLQKSGMATRKIWSKGFDKRFCFTDKDIGQRIQYVNKHNV
jgi:REP element-mobilizing transposase RayT